MRALFLLITSLLLISCEDNSTTFSIEGKTNGLPDGARVYVYEIDANNQPKAIDTLIIQNSSFSATFPKSEKASINYLKADYTNTNLYYFPENSDLKVVIYKDSINASTITGSPQNDNFNAYQKELNRIEKEKIIVNTAYAKARQERNGQEISKLTIQLNKFKNDITNHKISFVDNNPNSLYSAMIIAEMVNKRSITPAIATSKLNSLSPKILTSGIATKTLTKLNSLMASEIGGVAPNFSAPTPEGDILSLKDAMGEYTIIDFWASWCKPCRMENPNVVNVYNKYHDKGLNIISVSLDRANQKERWIKAIKDDKMDWHHVSNLQFWNDPIAKQYGVRSIPATYLLDKEGNIIDKNLRGKRLEDKIASLLN